MAQFANMFEVDLNNRSYPVSLVQTVSEGNVYSNRIGAYVYKDGAPVNLGGACTGLVMRADGTTVPMTGVIDGNAAYVVLNQESCAIPGPIQVAVSWVSGNNTTTLLVAYGTVITTDTRSYVQSGPIADVNTLLGYIGEVEQAAADAATSAASAAESAETAQNRCVRFDAAQSLTDTQKSQARGNIGAAGLAQVVRVDAAQSLTGAQKGTARDNIGAANVNTVVRYDAAQSLTGAQKGTARNNIDAADVDHISVIDNEIENIELAKNFFDIAGITCYDYNASSFIDVQYSDEIVADSGTDNHWLYLAIPLKNMTAGSQYLVCVIVHELHQAYFSSSNIGGQGTTSEAIYFSQNSAISYYTHNSVYNYLIVRFTGTARISFDTYAIDRAFTQRNRYMVASAKTSDDTYNAGVYANLTNNGARKNPHGNFQNLTVTQKDNYVQVTADAFTYTSEFSIIFEFISYDITPYIQAGATLLVQSYVGYPGMLYHFINLSTSENSYANTVVLEYNSVDNLVEFELDCSNLDIDTSGSVYLQIGVKIPRRTDVPALYSWQRVTQMRDLKQATVIADFLRGNNKSWYAGKTIAVIGDSIAQGNRWQPHVKQYFRCNIDTYAIGGTTVSNNGQRVIYDGNEIDAWMCSDDRINLITDNPDVVLIIAGHNDYGNNISLGELGEHTFDDTKFMPAYSLMIKKLIDKFPNAKIFSLGIINGKTDTANANMIYQPLNTLGLCMTDYSIAVKKVCEYYGIPCLDIGANSGINVFNHTTYIGDTIHPNDAGGRALAVSIVDGMKRYEPINFGVY